MRAPTGPLRPEMVAKLLSELDVVRTNMDIMNQVLSEVEPGKESPEETQLLDVSYLVILSWVIAMILCFYI